MERSEVKKYTELMVRYLNRRQIITVMWWDIFQPKKREMILSNMKDGMSAKFAYQKVKENEN
jgi:hypothetical protein